MQAAAERLAHALRSGLGARGSACVALSGGTTPGPAYALLAQMPLDWPRISFALVDERCVSADDPASNEGLLRRTLAPALAQGAQLAPMHGDGADARYAALHIDAALLGMGEDAHTASWFPGADGLDDALDLANPHTIAAVHAPKAGGAAARLTLTRTALARADRLILLIAGNAKRERLAAAQAQPPHEAPVAALFQPPLPTPEVLWAP